MYAEAEALQSEVFESVTKKLRQDHEVTLNAELDSTAIFYFDRPLSEAR